MKRGIVALLLVLALLLALLCPASLAENYEGEILFRGLPWLIDINTYASAIVEDMGIQYDDEDWSPFISNTDVAYFAGDAEHSEIRVSCPEGKSGYDFSLLYYEIRDGVSVAGYPIKWVSVQALRSVKNGEVLFDAENSRVISAGYTLDFDDESEGSEFDSAYFDLQQKLNSIYGLPHDAWETQDSFHTWRGSVWYGSNNTYVWLDESYYEGNSAAACPVEIKYGTLDAAIFAEEILNVGSTIDNLNTDGL